MNFHSVELSSKDWLIKAAQSPIAFSQVREDSLIDRELVMQLPDNSVGIMVASGGCTAALLGASGKFERLGLVDLNESQIGLTKLKLFLLETEDVGRRLEILGHEFMAPKFRKKELSRIFEQLSIAGDLSDYIDNLSAYGPDQSGRFEQLFSRLKFEINDDKNLDVLLSLNDPKLQQRFILENPQFLSNLKGACESVMTLPNLVSLFGTTATQNARMPFSEHFFEKTLIAIRTFPAVSNPYLNQFLRNKFTGANMHPWLSLPKIKFETAISYTKATIEEALLASNCTYDFIHLSNILDWLSEKEAAALLELCASKLAKNGRLIIRQLNSTLEVQSLCQRLDWQTATADKLHQTDRSFFYQKLHVAFGT